tara:strand:+ start:320 stop:505 length:186 start_codon:yes stop_codon:yes gene_type:complete
MNKITKREHLFKLLRVLGVNGFNDWFRETFGEPPPFIYITSKSKGFTSDDFIINEELLEEC